MIGSVDVPLSFPFVPKPDPDPEPNPDPERSSPPVPCFQTLKGDPALTPNLFLTLPTSPDPDPDPDPDPEAKGPISARLRSANVIGGSGMYDACTTGTGIGMGKGKGRGSATPVRAGSSRSGWAASFPV